MVWGGVLAAAAMVSPVMAQCQTDWSLHLPSIRTDADMAFDSTRGRVVMFGGFSSPSYRGDTWENDGNGWRRVATTGPSPRRGHKMVYDAAHRRTLLIGGFGSPAIGAVETWAWDGATWRLVDNQGPTFAFTSGAMQEAAAAYDPGRGCVVMILSNGETWEWNNQTWMRAATVGPSGGARRGVALAYDRGSARMILFGGSVSGTPRGDTWAWDGLSWTALAVTGAPAARSDHRMAYDSVSRRIIMYGGAATGGTRLRDTWTFSGTAWNLLVAGTSGPATVAGGSGSCMAYDSARRRVILLGGSNAPWTDICTLEGTTWRQTNPGPSARNAAASAYDVARRKLVLFGGLGTARQGDTWEFDGNTWAQVSTTGPMARSESAMAYDPVRRRTVLFGGTGSAGVMSDTWEWDGTSWIRINVSGPSARDRHAMCYDPISGQVMLEGGSVGGNETWLWDGAAWTRVANGPTRSSHAMVYHPATDLVVLYGGSGAGTGQTAWGWDGVNWMAVGGPGPSTAIEHTLTLEPITGNLVLLGPSASDAATWLFDGLTWRRVSTPTPGTLGPRARNNHSAWYDEALGSVCMYGGTVSSSPVRETWLYFGVAGPALARMASWVVACDQGTAQFSVEVANVVGAAPVETVTWIRNGAVVSPGPTGFGSTVAITSDESTRTYTLTITGTRFPDTGDYYCILTSSCGGATRTNPARLSICPADFDCSGTGSGDGVSQQDIFAYFTAYFGGDMRADFTRDGFLTTQDFFEYLTLYFVGC